MLGRDLTAQRLLDISYCITVCRETHKRKKPSGLRPPPLWQTRRLLRAGKSIQPSQRHATQEVRCPLQDVAVTTQSIVTMKKSCGFRGGTREAGEEIANLHHWHCPPRQVCTERSAVRVSQWRGEMRNQCHAESVTYELRRQESPDSCFGRGKNVSG